MTWTDRITALIMLAIWLGVCLYGIRTYGRHVDRKRKEFVSKRTMARYRNFDEGYPDDWK